MDPDGLNRCSSAQSLASPIVFCQALFLERLTLHGRLLPQIAALVMAEHISYLMTLDCVPK